MPWIPILYRANYQDQHWKNKVWPTAVNKIKPAGFSLLLSHRRLFITYLPSDEQDNWEGSQAFHQVKKFMLWLLTISVARKKPNPNSPPTLFHWSWMQREESQWCWMNTTGMLLLLPAMLCLVLVGPLEEFYFSFHLNLGKKPKVLPPITDSSVPVSLCLDNSYREKKKTNPLSSVHNSFHFWSSWSRD